MKLFKNITIIFGIFLFLSSSSSASLEVKNVTVTDGAGRERDRLLTSENIGLRIEVENVSEEVERINYRFTIYDPSGSRVFYHDGNSTPGKVGISASQLRNIPLKFYTGPGNYSFRGEAFTVMGDREEKDSKRAEFSVHSPVITLNYPHDRAQDLRDSPLSFRWSSSGAHSYNIKVSEDEGFRRVIWSQETPSDSINYPDTSSDDRRNLKCGIQYYWRVIGLDSSGRRISSSDVYSFSLRQDRDSRNLGIKDIYFNPIMSSFPDNVVFTAKVVNTGSSHEGDIKVDFFVGGRQAAQKRLPLIIPGSKTEINFNIGLFLQENIQATATLNIDDDDSRDNILTRNISVPVPSRWKDVPKITGRVIDRSTGEHLGGVKMRLSGPRELRAVTSSNGSYKFENLQPGNYIMTASHEGYKDSEPIRVTVDQKKAYPQEPVEMSRDIPEHTPESAWKVISENLPRDIVFKFEGYSPAEMRLIPDEDINYIIEKIKSGDALIRDTRIKIE